jgi:hypothetical protein
MGDFVVAIDFPSIKRYVFGTNAAREIRGASALLDLLNVEAVPRLLREALGGAYRELYMGGGAGMFAARDTTLDRLRETLVECRKHVHAKSDGGLELHWGDAPLRPQAGFGEAIREAHASLRAQRQAPPEPRPRGRVGILGECQSCSASGASKFHAESDGEVEWLCGRCDAKRKRRHDGRTWKTLIKNLGLPLEAKRYRHRDFVELGRDATSPGSLGLVYMDGDGLGALIQTLDREDQYALFSRTVDGSLQDALRDELAAWRTETRARNDAPLPIDILLLGGDDLVFVTRAELALRFATGVARRFQELTRQRLAEQNFCDRAAREHGLSVSAGVALFKSRQPFRTALDQAEELLRSAKNARADAAAHGGWVDFFDVRQSRFVDIDDARMALPGTRPGKSMTLWPMSVPDATRFAAAVQKLRKDGFGVGHAKRLARVVAGGRSVGFEVRRMLARGEPQRSAALRKFFDDFGMGADPPWRRTGAARSTAVFDLAVLLPLLDTRGEDA